MTESDFPNMFDDMTIFDEIDKQKLSKKQKKKLKKKKNKTNKALGEEGKASVDMEVIPLKEEKNSETSEDSVQKKPNEKKEVKSTPVKGIENEKKQESGLKQDSGKKSEKSQESSKKQDVEKKTEEEKVVDSGKGKEIIQKTPEKPSEKVPEKKLDKPQENIEKASAVSEKPQQKPQEKQPSEKPQEKPQPKVEEKTQQKPIDPLKDNNPQEKQIPPQEKQTKFPENNNDEFIEVTKKRPTLNREANKRFAPLGMRADPPKNTPNKGPIPLVKKESFEDRFKVEKDCRKKAIEMKTTGTNNKPQPTCTPARPVMSVNAPALNHKPINTTEIEPIPDPLNRTISMEKDSEAPAKITHGATLCKKKNANEVLKAKIKRKEIEKQGKTGAPFENHKTNSKEKPIEILRNESYEKKAANDSSVKKEYKGLSEKIFWWKMENDLNKFTDGIAAECKRMKVFRMCVFDRIEFIVSNLFEKFGAHIKMYGSCVTGCFPPDFKFSL